MPINPQTLTLLFQALRSAPTVVQGIEGALAHANNYPEGSFPQYIANNAISATQEALNRGYDKGLLEEFAQQGWNNLPMDIMPDPIVGGGGIVDVDNNPVYSTTGTGRLGYGNEFPQDSDIVKRSLFKLLNTKQ